jgi:hypothetical protein
MTHGMNCHNVITLFSAVWKRQLMKKKRKITRYDTKTRDMIQRWDERNAIFKGIKKDSKKKARMKPEKLSVSEQKNE